MGLRFTKRIKIAPGVTLNLSKSGISTSVGPRGAKVTVGHGQTRYTAGIPGTGLSHTTVERNHAAPTSVLGSIITAIIWIAIAAAGLWFLTLGIL